jgi:hypothetical protein
LHLREPRLPPAVFLTQPNAPATIGRMPKFEYKTEVLTSVVGRDKLRLNDLDAKLRQYGQEGWELVNLSLDADLRGTKDGHLLVFKREIAPL